MSIIDPLRDRLKVNACSCVGPQNGEPLCPCEMRHVIQRRGRWVRPEQDLGPVTVRGDSVKMERL